MVVLVVISVMTIISLSGGRILMMQFKNIRDFANSRTAFYAAEAGIEKGLLAYRVNRMNEIDGASISFTQGADVDYTSFYRGRQDDVGRVKKDDAYEVEVRGAGYDLEIEWDSAGTIGIRKILNAGTATVSIEPMDPVTISPKRIPITGTVSSIRLHAYGSDITGLSLSCSQDKCLSKKDTTIDSQASYRGVVRHLEAKVNRQSGLLQSLFDYTLFSQGDIR
jgi:hypothetical protein